jgi:AraC-like DNA-binding protein
LVFDDRQRPVLPLRSRLYPVEPIGIGTPWVESLSGYVSRLAEAHAVSVGDLVGRELCPIAAKPLASTQGAKWARRHSHGFHARGNSVNGFGGTSKIWIDALAAATLRSNLQFLTLSPLDGIFARHRVFRRCRAWCSRCLADWRSVENVVYEPLLWAVNLVMICPCHHYPLEEECSHCHRQLAPLAVNSRPGRCSYCQEWLGCSPEKRPLAAGQIADETLWRANAVGQLLACLPEKDPTSLGRVFATNLQVCADTVFHGNVLAFAEACQVSPSACRSHVLGQYLPTIDVILRICYRLAIPITALFETDRHRAEAHWKTATEAVQPNRAHSRRSLEQVRLLLIGAAQEQPAPSLSEIAARLGYKGPDRLYQVDSNLCKKIAARYRRSGRSHLWRKSGAETIAKTFDLRQLLEQSLAQEPSVSSYAIAARVGYANEGYLRQRFPELCRAIGRRVAKQKTERTRHMEKFLRQALKAEPAPTLAALRKRLGYSSSQCLQHHFPDLCRRILERRKLHTGRCIAKLQGTLEELLLQVPALSLRAASRLVGLSSSYLKKLCPQQCAALTSRYLRSRHDASSLRKQTLVEEV